MAISNTLSSQSVISFLDEKMPFHCLFTRTGNDHDGPCSCVRLKFYHLVGCARSLQIKMSIKQTV